MPEKNDNVDKNLIEFVDALIAEKARTEKISSEQKAVMRKELLEKLDERIDEEMLVALPEKKLKELNQKMTEGMNDEMLEEFLLKSGANFEAAVQEAMTAVGLEFLGRDRATVTTSPDNDKKATMTTNLSKNTNEGSTEAKLEKNVDTKQEDTGKVKSNVADIVAAGVSAAAEAIYKAGEER